MVSLRTLMLWLGVTVLVITTIVSLWVAFGEPIERPLIVALPLLIGSLSILAVTAVALRRSIEDDRSRLREYESRAFNRVKPLLLLLSAILFGMLTVYLGVTAIRAIEVESCLETSTAGGTIFEMCTTENEYWIVLFFAPFFIAAFLITVSSAAALVRDALANRRVTV